MARESKFCILFAGAIGSSKTPIANYLSCKLNLPILSNDVLRREVNEDLGEFNQRIYERRRDERFLDILERGISFIYDASIDRSWEERKKYLDRFGYRHFIISLDLSKEFLEKLYKMKDYQNLESLERTIKDHNQFLEEFGELVGLSISDKDFKIRMKLSLEAIGNWKKSNLKIS